MIREIYAVRRSGLTFEESVRVARRRAKPGLYMIKRHGLYFRPGARGYTSDIAYAGTYDHNEAAAYLDVEGLSIIPVTTLVAEIRREIAGHEARAYALKEILYALASKDAGKAKGRPESLPNGARFSGPLPEGHEAYARSEGDGPAEASIAHAETDDNAGSAAE